MNKEQIKQFLEKARESLSERKKELQKLKQFSNAEKFLKDESYDKIFYEETFLSSEIVSLFLEYKANYSPSRQKQKNDMGKSYQPFIIDDYKMAKNFLAEINRAIENKQPFIYNFFSKLGSTHIIPIKLYYDGINKPLLFYVDSLARSDSDNCNFWEINIRQAGGLAYSPMLESTQANFYACHTFAIQNLNALSNMNTNSLIDKFYLPFYEVLQGKSILEQIDARFIKHSQIKTDLIISHLEKRNDDSIYADKHQKKNVIEYINEFSYFVPFVHKSTRIITKQNRSIDLKLLKYIEKALEILESTSEEAFQQIIENRMSFENKNTFYDNVNSQNIDFKQLLSTTLKSNYQNDDLIIPSGFEDVEHDGFCFYHAIARLINDGVTTAESIQQMAINEIISNPDSYQIGLSNNMYIGNENEQSRADALNSYLSYHLQHHNNQENPWADHIMIQATANVLHADIRVHMFNTDGTPQIYQSGEHQGNNVVMTFAATDSATTLNVGNIENSHFIAQSLTEETNENSNIYIPNEHSSSYATALLLGIFYALTTTEGNNL